MSENSERNTVLIVYGLYLLGLFTGGFSTLIGVILAHIRLEPARGSLYESHYRNMILVFWVWLAVVAVAGAFAFAGIAGLAFSLIASWPYFGLALIPAGFTVWLMLLGVAVAGLWYYWRLIKGLALVLDDKPF
jgi:uncharacterized membrane protein